ncbi:hypothetical protein C0584_03440, partial [Candidatus Parcubacteria bacterium]
KVIGEVESLVDCLVVVVDGASDKTYEKAIEERSRLADKSKVVILRHLINRGQGASLETGNEYSRKSGADIVVHFDADGQFLSSEISSILNPIINEGRDIVFGSRFLGKDSNMPFFKKQVIMRIGRLVNKLLLGLNLTDPQNGFRAMNKRALDKITIEQDGSAHCSEILSKTVSNNLKYKEVPVTVRYFDFGQGFFSGKGRGKGGFVIVRDLLIGKFIK